MRGPICGRTLRYGLNIGARGGAMIRVYDHGTTYGISIGQPEIQGFCLGRPPCGLQGLRGLWLTFDRTSGNLVGLQIKGKIDHAQLDDATFALLGDSLKRHVEAKLSIHHSPGHHWRVDWRQYLARKRNTIGT